MFEFTNAVSSSATVFLLLFDLGNTSSSSARRPFRPSNGGVQAVILACGMLNYHDFQAAQDVDFMKFYDSSKRSWVFISVFVVIVAVLGWGMPSAIKQHRDRAAVRDWINRVQTQLLADPRFKDVQLFGYCCDDDVRYPYIPVLGWVADKKDWDALDRFIQKSEPPAYINMAVGLRAKKEMTQIR